MKVGGEVVVEVKVVANEMQMTWFGTWKDWIDLHFSTEFRVLKEKYEMDLKNSTGKGEGSKGKKGQ